MQLRRRAARFLSVILLLVSPFGPAVMPRQACSGNSPGAPPFQCVWERLRFPHHGVENNSIV